jgi:hypothetical protein
MSLRNGRLGNLEFAKLVAFLEFLLIIFSSKGEFIPVRISADFFDENSWYFFISQEFLLVKFSVVV